MKSFVKIKWLLYSFILLVILFPFNSLNVMLQAHIIENKEMFLLEAKLTICSVREHKQLQQIFWSFLIKFLLTNSLKNTAQ